jgi:ABC-type glycerol-3-phosphate transport system substrate-binding protein
MIVSAAEVGTMARVNRAALALTLALAAAGCGGTDDAGSGGTTSATPTTAPITVTTQADTAQAEPKPTGKPEFRVQLTGESRQATAGQPWRYIVRATTPSGAPVNGTAKMRVFLEGELVDTLGFFVLNDAGTLNRTHRWPAILKGKSVELQAEVEGAGGTQRVNYAVTIN